MQRPGRKRLYLMRHGHVDYFAEGITDPRTVPLTDRGREQATAAREALSSIDFEVAFHSGLPRARETAEIVLAEREISPELQAQEGLEEIKSGWLQADTREELAARLAYSFDNADAPSARFLPDGEYFADTEKRVSAALRSIILDYQWNTALVVAHEGVNRIALGWMTGGGLKTIPSFEQDLACINVIDVDVTPSETGEGFQIERMILRVMNLTPYDYVKHGLSRSNLEHLFDVDFGVSRPSRASASPSD